LKPLSAPLARYLEKGDNLSLPILGVIDDEMAKNTEEPIDRSLLLSALIFPIFSEQVQEKSKMQEKPLHLGQIAEIAHRTIDLIFSPFFSIPRRMRGIMGFIMTTQYRFIPIDGRPVKRPRAPRDPFFPMALHLLKILALVEPVLLPHYTLWTEAAYVSHEQPEMGDSGPPERQRRRRRRRPDSSEKPV